MTTSHLYPQINLIENGSFESINTCPNNGGQMDYATKWFNVNDKSSDLFSTCSSNMYCSVPNNFFGNQMPFQGNNYVGITTYWESVNNYREFVGTKLNNSLDKNSVYTISMYISSADSCKYYTKNLHVGFYNDTVNINKPIIEPNDKIYFSTSNINWTDNVNWQKTETIFIANGTENYLTIGNFDNDLNSTVLLLNNGVSSYYDFSYVYIDSVSIKKTDFIPPNVFTPNGDGVNDKYFLSNTFNIPFQIFDRWGVKVFDTEITKQCYWNGSYMNEGNELSDGTYFLVSKITKSVITKIK